MAGKEISLEALSADIVVPKNEAYSRMGARALSAGMGANGVGGSANGDDQILSELMVGVISLSSLLRARALSLSVLVLTCNTNKRTGEGKGFRRKGEDP